MQFCIAERILCCRAQLRDLVGLQGLTSTIVFLTNVSDEERRSLLESCVAVVYTPSYEHFGIVPLEAMAAGRPVIAVGLGGPCESIVHGETGWLCEPSPGAFADAFEELLGLHVSGALMRRGLAARTHVERRFGLESFGRALEAHLTLLCTKGVPLVTHRTA